MHESKSLDDWMARLERSMECLEDSITRLETTISLKKYETPKKKENKENVFKPETSKPKIKPIRWEVPS